MIASIIQVVEHEGISFEHDARFSR